MLVLARKPGQRIILTWGGREVVITFVGHRHTPSVAIGIDAPSDIVVHREEVQDEIDRGEARGRVRA